MPEDQFQAELHSGVLVPSTELAKLQAKLKLAEEALAYYASHGKGRHDCPTCDGGDQAEDALAELRKA